MWATVISDASYCPTTGSAGWAVWITFDNKERIKKFGSFKRKPKDSNEAELWASMNGIYLAYKGGADCVLVQSDSMYVVDKFGKENLGVDGVYLEQLKSRHVKGHTTKKDNRSFVNRWCDEKAGVEMRKQRKLSDIIN